MIAKVTGERSIEAFLAYELTLLASMINVDERLNLQTHQIPVIAHELVRTFAKESLADFHVCFLRGSMGYYDDKLLRLDGAVITQWMRKYLEEKYALIESQLMSERESMYSVKRHADPRENVMNPERNLLAAYEVVVNGKDPGVDMSKHLKPEELEEFEKNRNKASKTKQDDNSKENAYQRQKLENPYKAPSDDYVKTHDAKLRELQEKSFRSRHPNATDEQVKQFFKSIE